MVWFVLCFPSIAASLLPHPLPWPVAQRRCCALDAAEVVSPTASEQVFEGQDALLEGAARRITLRRPNAKGQEWGRPCPPAIKLAKEILMTFPSGGKCVIKQAPLSIAQSYLLI